VAARFQDRPSLVRPGNCKALARSLKTSLIRSKALSVERAGIFEPRKEKIKRKRRLAARKRTDNSGIEKKKLFVNNGGEVAVPLTDTGPKSVGKGISCPICGRKKGVAQQRQKQTKLPGKRGSPVPKIRQPNKEIVPSEEGGGSF